MNRKVLISTILAIILVSVTGCQQARPTAEARILPTFASTRTPPPSPTPTFTPTPREPLATALPSMPSQTSTASAESSATVTPTPTTRQLSAVTTPTAPVPSASATRQPPNLPAAFSFGQSVQGRSLNAYRLGTGGSVIMLVGGIHNGFEANTVTLVEELTSHFQLNPADVLPGISLILIPNLNPDGAQFGRQLRGRFNGAEVDLNRNWDCEWEPAAFFRDNEVDPGAQPFSEPESLALAALINDLRPDIVLFYHAAANGVYPGRCDDNPNSELMARVLADSTGYPLGEGFAEYEVSGTAPDWVDSLGLYAADVELASAELTEFIRNLRGVMALQCWLLGESVATAGVCR